MFHYLLATVLLITTAIPVYAKKPPVFIPPTNDPAPLVTRSAGTR